MANYNKTILVGNCTRDVQIKALNGGTHVAEFGLAVNHKFKTKDGEPREEVLFIDCAIFGKGAEILNQYARKGKPLLVEGRLKLDQWEDKNGGGKRSKISLIVDNFQFLGGRDDAQDGGGPPARQERRPAEAPARQSAAPARSGGGGYPRPAQAESAPFGDNKEFNEEDIPFRCPPAPFGSDL